MSCQEFDAGHIGKMAGKIYRVLLDHNRSHLRIILDGHYRVGSIKNHRPIFDNTSPLRNRSMISMNPIEGTSRINAVIEAT